MKRLIILLLLPLIASCGNMDYDISGGVDREVTLFGDQVSIPLGDIGPVTLKSLIGGEGVLDAVKAYVREDEEGYLVVQDQSSFYTNFIALMAYMAPDQTVPLDFPLGEMSGNLSTSADVFEGLGFTLSPQVFSLRASNPLSEGIAISGSMQLQSLPSAESPAETLASRELSRAVVEAGATEAEIATVELTGGKPISSYLFQNLFLHLPASFLLKDPQSGMSTVSLSYQYKSFLALGNDFPGDIPIELNDLDLPLGQYRVKEARICTEVSSEIPVTFELSSVDVFVKQTDAEGNVSTVEYEDVSITPGLRINSGCSGSPVVSPLEIVIKAGQGTIPDIAGLRLNLAVKAPTGEGDKRLGMDQKVYFNHIRATVAGGITIQGL